MVLNRAVWYEVTAANFCHVITIITITIPVGKGIDQNVKWSRISDADTATSLTKRHGPLFSPPKVNNHHYHHSLSHPIVPRDPNPYGW